MSKPRANCKHCAECGELLAGKPTGESSIYSPHITYVLCEPCWLVEDGFIEQTGRNNHPERLKHYADTAARLG